jgi:hypothetical protein
MALNNISVTTELEAVNAMLAAIGEAPVSSLTSGQVDAEMAEQILRDTVREIQTRGWRFNTTKTLPVPAPFTLGATVASATPSRVPAMRGLDLVLTRNGSNWTVKNRIGGGIPSVSEVFLDVAYFMPFDSMPESARRYAVVTAARRLQAQAVGSPELVGFSAEDEETALQSLQSDQKVFVPIVSEGTPGTDLDALNVMLASVGVEPAMALNALGDIQAVALNTLRETHREVLSRGWRFNTDAGMVLEPSHSYTQDGVTYNVFTAPANLLSFTVSRTPDMRGKDPILRRSRVSTPTGMVIADRYSQQDGYRADTTATLSIDPVWFIPFGDLPDAARRYIAVQGARKLRKHIPVPMENLSGFSEEDEAGALQALILSQRPSTPVIPTGVPVSELDALNLALAGAGLDPASGLDGSMSERHAEVLNLLRATTREVLSHGWRFNTEHGFPVFPDGQVADTPRPGYTLWLNVFHAPEDLLAFQINRNQWQQGGIYVDVEVRPSRVYRVNEKPVRVFYDRAANIDGHLRDILFIDPVWAFDFDTLPESARWYITILTSRRFSARFPDRPDTFSSRDELLALRTLRREQGTKDNHNIFHNLTVSKHLGRRPPGPSGSFDPRWS